jgi:hypothetical protein
LFIGDSVGEDISWGVAKQIGPYRSLHLALEATANTGLANTPYFNWPAHLAHLLAKYHPHLVVVALGANDLQSLQVHGQVYRFGTPSWRVAYSAQVSLILRESLAAHAMVLWVGLPIMQPWGYWQSIQTLNGLDATVVSQFAGARYLDTWNVLTHPVGVYAGSAPVNGIISQLRSADGIHLWPTGEAVMGTFITRYLHSEFNLPVVPQRNAIITAH